MRARDVSAATIALYHMRRPGMIWGPPGIGKTDVVEQACAQLGIRCIDFRVALRDPTDLKGYPMADLKAGLMRYLHDEELPRDGEGILYFDEMNNGLPAVQACAMQLNLARRIGTYTLPDGWSTMASGNRDTDRGVTYSMPTPLANRFVHLNMEPNNEDWVNWAMQNNISARLIAFHRWKTDHLFTFNPQSGAKAFGTPRSWVTTDDIMAASNLSEHVKYEMLKGTVGDGEAIEYVAFIKLQSQLPSIEEVLARPEKIDISDDPSILYSLVTMVATHVTPKNFETIAKFTARMRMEYQAVFIRDVLVRHPAIKETKPFQSWALKNHEILV